MINARAVACAEGTTAPPSAIEMSHPEMAAKAARLEMARARALGVRPPRDRDPAEGTAPLQ